jgi:hypothetical protein
LAAGTVLHVGQQVGSLCAHRFVVSRLEMSDVLRAVCPPLASRIPAWPARLFAGRAECSEAKLQFVRLRSVWPYRSARCASLRGPCLVR